MRKFNLATKISVIADFDRNNAVAGADRIATSMRPGHQGGYASPGTESLCWERTQPCLPQPGQQRLFGRGTADSPTVLHLLLVGLKPAARHESRFLALGG